MKKKSLFAALFVAIILISSCILGVEENERASVSFKLKTTSASRNTGTDIPSYEGHNIVVSIKDAETRRVIISQTLPITTTSCTFDEIQVGLTIIGKVEFFYGGDKPEETFRSLPHTVTDRENILTALNMVTIDDLIGTWVAVFSDSGESVKSYIQFTENKIIDKYAVIYYGNETISNGYELAYIAQFDGANPKKVTIRASDPEYDNGNYFNYFDSDITFDANNNSFEILIEEEVYEAITYTRYTGKLPVNTTTNLSTSDLHGTWTGTVVDREYIDGQQGNYIATLTEDETYTFTQNSYTILRKVIESTYIGSDYPWAVKGYADTQTYNITQYVVNGAEITISGTNSVNPADTFTRTFTFLNGVPDKTVTFMDYVIYTKQP